MANYRFEWTVQTMSGKITEQAREGPFRSQQDGERNPGQCQKLSLSQRARLD